jgi:hypothetical protein
MTDLIGELTRSGGPSAKWDAIGDVRRIVIDDVEKRQVTDFVTGEPQTWPNGDPKWQFVFSGTDPDTGDETRFFCKGFQLGAVKEALRSAGVSAGDTLTGGTLAIKWTGEEPSKTKGMSPAKTWSAQYKPAAANAVTDDLI